MWYFRFYLKELSRFVKSGRVLVAYGPGRVVKTTVLKIVLTIIAGKAFSGAGEDQGLKEAFRSPCRDKILTVFSGCDLVFISEAQKIPNAGEGLKMLVDHRPDFGIVVRGSSLFRLSCGIGEEAVVQVR
ncbi:MAG: hypothetical protein CSA81_01435 [Acidobacteria bacterium]|nr:MAG: hypothetical protein CSA81_01435 [Acidobacteriota bacterium]